MRPEIAIALQRNITSGVPRSYTVGHWMITWNFAQNSLFLTPNNRMAQIYQKSKIQKVTTARDFGFGHRFGFQ